MVRKNVCSIPFDLEFIAAGTGEDIREATESESDSFASQQFFAEEALGGIEEELLGLKLWLCKGCTLEAWRIFFACKFLYTSKFSLTWLYIHNSYFSS